MWEFSTSICPTADKPILNPSLNLLGPQLGVTYSF